MDEETGRQEKIASEAWAHEPRSPWAKMGAIIWKKPQRLFIAAGLSLFTLIFVLWHAGWTDSISSSLRSPRLSSLEALKDYTGFSVGGAEEEVGDASWPQDSLPAETPTWPTAAEKVPFVAITGTVTTSTEATTSAPFPTVAFTPTIDPYAHRRPNANKMQDHFVNVSFYPSITLAQAKAGCHWTDKDEVNFQFGESSGWGVNLDWVKNDVSEDVIQLARDAWRKFVFTDALEFDKYVHKFEGRGIVIVGGNGRSLKRTKVILRQLKKLGSKLPVELHYWGAELLEHRRLVSELLEIKPDLHLNNLASPDNITPTVHGGMVHYALKTAAMINSRFAHMLMLDTDNIPVQDPDLLFDSETYQEYGTIFWPDVARTRVNNPIWPITNTRCRMDEWEQESGQLVVNKIKFWYHLQLAHFFNSDIKHGDFFRSIMLGDKDTFRFAWHALETKFGMPPKFLASVGTLHDDFFCGHTFGQFGPNGKLAFLHGGLLKTMRKEVVIWEAEENGGVFQAYKESPYPTDNSFNPKVWMKFDGQEYLPESRKPPGGLEVSWCMDFDHIDSHPLEAILPGFQETYHEIGGYWIKEDSGTGSITDGSL